MNKSSLLGKSGVFLSESSFATQSKQIIPVVRDTNFQTVHKYLSPGDVFYQDSKSRSLLYYACYYNKPDTFLYLVNKGVSINQLDSEGRNLWHVCAYAGSLYCFGILLAHTECLRRMVAGRNLKQALQKYKLKKSDYHNAQLLTTATDNKTKDFASFKVAAKSIIQTYFSSQYEDHSSALSTQDSSELRTPIHLCSLNKAQRSFQVLQMMLRQTEMQYKDYLELSQRISSLIEKYEDPRIYNNVLSDLQNAVGIKQFNDIKQKESEDFFKFIKSIINLKDKGGFTALHLSSYQGSSAISSLLKKFGAQISDPDGAEGENVVQIAKNNTVRNTIIDLCEASEKGDNGTINLLINCGQDINIKRTIFGITPLYNSILYCESTNKLDPAKILLQNGAEIDVQDVNGWTSLHKACEIGNIEMVELLLSKKARTNKVSNKGWSPLHIAAINDHYQIISLLHSKIKDLQLEAKDHEGSTALILAAKRGSNKALEQLIKLGANLYASDNKKMTSLHYASFKQHNNTIKILLCYDADADKLRPLKNCHGKPAKQLSSDSTTRACFDNIWSGSREGKLDIVRRLILQGADKDEQTPKLKRTALMYAASGGHIPVLKYLLEQGASTYHEDSNQQTVSNYITQYSKLIPKQGKEKGNQVVSEMKRILSQFQS